MVTLLNNKRCGPIGIDLGSRSVKLVQFNSDCTRLVDMASWDFPAPPGPDGAPEDVAQHVSQSLRQGLKGRRFRGRPAAVCLHQGQLFLQNVRLPADQNHELGKRIQQEATSRLPYSIAEAEIRYIEAADVQQGDHTMREVILFASRRSVIESILGTVEDAGLSPVAVDVEPAALLRAYLMQFRREEDHRQRTLFVHVGYAKTAVIIAEGEKVLFVKYLDVGGRQLDQAVATHLQMELSHAERLRRHNGDRRADQQDPEVAQGVATAVRPVIEQLIVELSRCIRYYSVTFRGKTLARTVLGGGEASQSLADRLSRSLELTCHLSDPLRKFLPAEQVGRRGRWDVAAGLALRSIE